MMLRIFLSDSQHSCHSSNFSSHDLLIYLYYVFSCNYFKLFRLFMNFTEFFNKYLENYNSKIHAFTSMHFLLRLFSCSLAAKDKNQKYAPFTAITYPSTINVGAVRVLNYAYRYLFTFVQNPYEYFTFPPGDSVCKTFYNNSTPSAGTEREKKKSAH